MPRVAFETAQSERHEVPHHDGKSKAFEGKNRNKINGALFSRAIYHSIAP
jgi:hypothetical protein